MRLELNIVDIKDIRFAEKTGIDKGQLNINRKELIEKLKEDRMLGEVNIDLTRPGEKCRIIRTADIIEPRAKIAGGQDFPGALGKQSSAGQGKTCVLRGAAVVLSEDSYQAGALNPEQAGDVIDMSGPAAEMSPYGKTCNIVIVASPARDASQPNFRVALKLAGMKAAVYLAQAGRNIPPDSKEVYDLDLIDRKNEHPDLPRVVYISQILTNQYVPVTGDPVLYGDNVERTAPTILHPNELLDGAVAVPLGHFFVETYLMQNHPIILELYRNHGKTLYFAGVIITNAPNNVSEFERAANIAANLAKWVLDADGAILTKTGGGAPELTLAKTAQRCEQLGIKTALALLHMGLDTTDTNLKPGVIFNAPEIDAMVSMGAPTEILTLPPVERVIGPPSTPQVYGEIVKIVRSIKGSLSQVGNSKVTAVKY
jgi:glycine reductase complex component B subunit alpha and beta